MTEDATSLANSRPHASVSVSGNGRHCRRVLSLLAFVYLSTVFAGFLAPYDPAAQNRDLAFAPPTRLRFVDGSSRLHLRPFVYGLARAHDTDEYAEDRSRIYPVRFFVRGAPYRVAGILGGELHLFGTESPRRLFLMGSDDYGRDQFSRFLHGGQFSLFAGLLGAGLSLGVGMVLGGLAGFYGAWVDETIMRAAELFLALPWMYLLLAVRMALPLQIEPAGAFLLVLAVIGLIGWAARRGWFEVSY